MEYRMSDKTSVFQMRNPIFTNNYLEHLYFFDNDVRT